jgi:Ice-binding-like/Bacterial Ig-like domain
MTVMRRYSDVTTCFIALLLVILGAGCGDPDKSGRNPGLIPPTVTSVAPPNGSVACPNTIVTATFSKAMNPAYINGSTFTLAGPGTAAVAGVVTYDAPSNTAIFTPSSPLAFSTLYTATVTTGAKDAYGNALAADYVWSFTTGATTCLTGAPTVVSVVNSTCPSTVVVATFSEAMNPSTISTTTFTLTGTGGAAVAGTVTYDGPSLAATFTPTNTLAVSTLYTITITSGAQNLFGTPLANNHVSSFTTAASQCIGPVPMGAACGFGTLGFSTVTNTGPTIITGDVGLSPGTSVTGFPPGTIIGTLHTTDPAAAAAQGSLTAAYNYAANVPGGISLTGTIGGGTTLPPGVYKTINQPALLVTGNLTLDGGGNANSVWIFQISSTLTTANNSHIFLINGASAQNIFWQVGSSATLGTGSTFQGTIMAQSSVTLTTLATLNGRALARTGAVTLDSNTVNTPACRAGGG